MSILTKSVVLKSITLLCMGGISALVGGFDSLLKALIIMMLIDLIIGFARAWKDKQLNSKIGWFGTVRKFVSLILIIFAVQMDTVMNTGTLVRSVVILYFIANEGLSIVENSRDIGIPLPKFVTNALLMIKQKADDGNDKTSD
jgi:toxin secretion/phage lysis holin